VAEARAAAEVEARAEHAVCDAYGDAPEREPDPSQKVKATDSDGVVDGSPNDAKELERLQADLVSTDPNDLDELRSVGHRARLQPQALFRGPAAAAHTEFVLAAAALRAAAYHLPPTSRDSFELLASGITPCLAPVASVVAGLAVLELCKALQGGKPAGMYRNTFLSRGPLARRQRALLQCEPSRPKRVTSRPFDFGAGGALTAIVENFRYCSAIVENFRNCCLAGLLCILCFVLLSRTSCRTEGVGCGAGHHSLFMCACGSYVCVRLSLIRVRVCSLAIGVCPPAVCPPCAPCHPTAL
jgi:hypothetical protein